MHGIVDSMWLKKPYATNEEYTSICKQIEKELDLPISFEGRYKWVVFLNSRINPLVPVLNRYYGIFQDGSLKVRGIDLRRHDVPKIVTKCQNDMLTILSEAQSSLQFRKLIPKALSVARYYVSMVRARHVPVEDFVMEKRLSKIPNEYTNLVEQAIAARHLVRRGKSVHAGQSINYVTASNGGRISENRALPIELLHETVSQDSEKYVELLLSSAMNLLLPFGYDLNVLRKALS